MKTTSVSTLSTRRDKGLSHHQQCVPCQTNTKYNEQDKTPTDKKEKHWKTEQELLRTPARIKYGEHHREKGAVSTCCETE